MGAMICQDGIDWKGVVFSISYQEGPPDRATKSDMWVNVLPLPVGSMQGLFMEIGFHPPN